MKYSLLRSVLVTLILLLITSNTTNLYGQLINRCATVEMDSILRANNPQLPDKEEFENWLAQEISNNASAHVIGGVYYIPVVFHIIHNGEAVGSGTNVSFAAVQSQIDVLNEDFRKITGSNGYNTHPLGADTEIEFCLAQRRPDGSAFPAGEPGVNRINRSTVGFTAPPFSTNYIDNTIKPYTYNNNNPTATRGWDPAKYMNIWICNISGGILGYAQFPTTPLGGMGCGSQNAATDGVVFTYNSIGKSSVTGFSGPFNEGRTATHEIGHWLGLRHIWGDGGCGVDDFCNDTPLSDAPNYNCPTNHNSCTDPAPDPNDMVQNYMDYTNDICMNIFTYDQKIRMRTVLESSPLRLSLINSDACTPPNANDASIVDIINPSGDNCPGSITPTVVLRNRGSNNLNNATISYQIDNGPVSNFSWTGNLTPGNSANVNLAAFTSTLGIHSLKVYSSLPNGLADPAPVYDTMTINFVVSNGIMPDFTEDFEGQNFPPDIKWNSVNGGNDCYQWVGASAVSSSGVANNNVAHLPFYNNNSGQSESLITPIFILPCNASAASLNFDVAYRRRATGDNDRLRVDISTDCGNTWVSTPIFDKSGNTLSTVTGTQTSSFYPNAGSQWRNETINLLPFVSGTSENVQFRFRGTADGGNNIFIDNIEFNATTPAEIEVEVAGTEVLDGGYYNYGIVTVGSTNTAVFTINNTGTSNLTLSGPISITGTGFSLLSNFGTTTVTPGGSTSFSVNFVAPTAGVFVGNVSFGTNDCDETTYNFELNGSTNTSPPTADFNASGTTVCGGSSVSFTDLSVGATSWSWNFGPGAVPATSTAQNPTVIFNNAGTNTVSLTITNAFGTDTETKTNYITVLPGNGLPLPIVEGFTSPTFAPAGWTIYDQGGSVTWNRSNTVGFAPTAGNSLVFDNFNFNDSPNQDEIHMPGADFQGLSSATLTFDVAYARYSAANSDGLMVLISTDCGETFTQVYDKSGTTLATAPNTTTLFTPTNAQWRTETIDLTPYIGNSKAIIAFRNIAGYGNRLFIDNINLSGIAGTNLPVAGFSGTPTTVCEGQSVSYTNTSSGSPTSYSWSFPGGTPASSSAANPVVTYTTSGVYNVSLTATNANGSDVETLASYITVNANPVITLNSFNPVCANTPAFTLSGGSPAGGSYSGTGVSAGQFNPSTAGFGNHVITYTYTNPNGCTGTTNQTIEVGCASVDEINNNSIKIYPNPAYHELTIESDSETIESIRLYDAWGRIVSELSNVSGLQKMVIDISAFAPGIYSLEISTISSMTKEHIVISK